MSELTTKLDKANSGDDLTLVLEGGKEMSAEYCHDPTDSGGELVDEGSCHYRLVEDGGELRLRSNKPSDKQTDFCEINDIELENAGSGGDEEPEMMTDGGKDTDAINAELSDDEITSAINSQGGGGDHPDAITVDEVRDALAFIAESAQEVWSTWMDNIEDGNAEVVEETADVLVVSTGSVNVVSEELDAMDYEGRLNREGEDRSVLASIITNCMHKIARNHSDRNWSVDYPWVLPARGRDGQQYVEAVVNGLQRRGLTPGQAWAYYGVEIRGESRNSWGRRKGDHDHKNVSDALEKAKQKLP